MSWNRTIVCIHALAHGFKKGKEDWIQWGIEARGWSVSRGKRASEWGWNPPSSIYCTMDDPYCCRLDSWRMLRGRVWRVQRSTTCSFEHRHAGTMSLPCGLVGWMALTRYGSLSLSVLLCFKATYWHILFNCFPTSAKARGFGFTAHKSVGGTKYRKRSLPKMVTRGSVFEGGHLSLWQNQSDLVSYCHLHNYRLGHPWLGKP